MLHGFLNSILPLTSSREI